MVNYRDIDSDGNRVVVKIDGVAHVMTYREASKLARKLEKSAIEVAENIRQNEEYEQ